MKDLGVLPSETIIVEDSPYGIEAATKSGALVLKVGSVDEVNLDLLKSVMPGII